MRDTLDQKRKEIVIGVQKSQESELEFKQVHNKILQQISTLIMI